MRTNRRLGVLAAAIAGVVGGANFARAATHTWQGLGISTNQPGNGEWSADSSWNGGDPPFDGTTNELVFGGQAGATAYQSNNDWDTGDPFNVSIMRFTSVQGAGVTNTIAAFPGATIRFINNGNTTPSIVQQGTATFNITAPMIFNNNMTITGNSAGTGTVRLTGPINWGTNNASLTIGGVLTLESAVDFQDHDIRIAGATTNVAITGTSTLTTTGGGVGSLTRVNTYTGATNIQGSTISLAGNGRITATPSVNFGTSGGFGTLILDNSGSIQDRLVDSAPLTIGNQGGGLTYIGNAAASTETVGSLTVNGGASRVQVTSQGGAAATLAFGNFARSGGLIDFSGNGGTLGAAATGPRVTFAAAPILTNGIMGGWATVGFADFATYGANGVTAFTGSTPLPSSGFDANTNYQATGNVTLTGGGDTYTLKLNPGTNAQTIDLGANNLNVNSGLLKTGAGTTTITGTGALGSGGQSGDLIMTIGQGTLNFNAPFAATNWVKAGAGTLNLTISSSPNWQVASFTGTVGLDVTANATIAGQLAGAGALVKTGSGTLTLTNNANGYSGGTTINAGTIEMKASTASPSIALNNTNNGLLGNNGGPLVINGGTLKLTVGNTNGTITLGRSMTFGVNGGTLDLNNTIGGTLGGDMALNTTSGATAPAVFRFNGGERTYSDTGNPPNWNSGGNVLRFNALNGTGPVRIELTKGGTVRQGAGSNTGNATNVAMAFTIAGPSVASGGDPSSGPAGTVDTSRSLTTGRIATDAFNVLNYQQGLFLEGALQMAVQGSARAIDGNVTLRGITSGNPAYVAFSGRGTGTALGSGGTSVVQNPGQGGTGQNPLYIGQGRNDTLTIEDGAIASMDLRIRMDQANHNGVFLDAQSIIQGGGTLRFTQSLSNAFGGGITGGNVGYNLVRNNITGQGTSIKDANVDLYLPQADLLAANLATNGVEFSGTNVAVIVNGTGLGGLRVNGLSRPNKLFASGSDPVANNVKIANLLTPARLAGLTGSGGFLTPAAQNATFNFPAASEWAANVPVGLRATNSNAGGTDVALPASSTWSHNLHVDAAAALGVNGVTVNAGTTSGLGTLEAGAGGVRFSGTASVRPGAAGVAGTLAVAGNATLDAGSTVVSDINSVTSNTLRTSGNASITGGNLSVNAVAVPTGGHRWDVLLADGTLTGKFATATLPADETGTKPRVWSLVYEPNRVSVGFTIQGDADYSGTVNFSDLLALARHYNQSNTQWIDGDFSRDGTVNFNDLLALARNYNQSTPSEVAGASAEFNADLASAFAAVPEPGSLGLIGLGATALLGSRRRRRA